MKPFTWIKCVHCDGHGMVSDYGSLGRDFEGPAECDDCGGSGQIVRYESGVLAQYPGGPLRGRDPIAHSVEAAA